MFDANLNRIRFVPQHKLFSYLNSTIDPVATNPIYLIQSNGFQFYPITQGTAKFECIVMQTPDAIFWNLYWTQMVFRFIHQVLRVVIRNGTMLI